MTNVVDFDEHKNRQDMRATLGAFKKLSHSPIEWRFRRKALRFMNEIGLDAPDLLNIFQSAFCISDFSGDNTFIVSGLSTDGVPFSFAIAVSEEPLCLKILKGWKSNLVAIEKSA